jgi:hypothetical protein
MANEAQRQTQAARTEGHRPPDDGEASPYEQVISPHQAITEALARLGPCASASAVQEELAARGVRASVEQIERACAEACAAAHGPVEEGPTRSPRSDPTNPYDWEAVGAWARSERAREY